MPSFLEENKLIIVDDDRYFKSSETNAKKFEKYISDKEKYSIPVCIVFFSEKSVKSTNKIKKKVMEIGRIFNAETPKIEGIKKELITYLKENNGYMDFKTMTHYINSVGEDLYKLINELDKIIQYKRWELKEKDKTNDKLPNVEITEKDINNISYKTQDAKMYEITQALEYRQNKFAVTILSENFKDKKDILAVISYFYGYYFDIYKTILAMEYGVNPDIVLNLPPNKKFLLNKYRSIGQRLGKRKVLNILKELSDIDLKSKTDDIDIILLFKMLLMSI